MNGDYPLSLKRQAVTCLPYLHSTPVEKGDAHWPAQSDHGQPWRSRAAVRRLRAVRAAVRYKRI